MDFNNMRLRCRIDSGVVDTIAGNGVHAFAFQNAPALESPFENPIDFAFLPNGEVVIVSLHDPRVLVVDQQNTLRLIAGTGNVGDGGDGGPADQALFSELAGVAVDTDGSIFVSDDLANRVRVIRPDGNIYAYAGTGAAGDAGDGGAAQDAQLFHPEGLALDRDGHLYVADTYNHRVRRIDAVTGLIETVAGTGSEGSSGDGGPARSAELNYPRGVRVAPDGRLYIADTFNHRVRRIEKDGTLATVAGSTKGYGGDGGLATEALLRGPAHIEVDDHTLFIPDQQNQVVRLVYLAP
jgi:DNA-binding beta-propeller fold protein YncE